MISPELKQVILSTLKLREWEINGDTVADQVPGWDSLGHLSVVMAVEEYFGIRFRGREVLGLKNVGDLQRLVDSKLQAKSADSV